MDTVVITDARQVPLDLIARHNPGTAEQAAREQLRSANTSPEETEWAWTRWW
jgi:hypothetical protein